LLGIVRPSALLPASKCVAPLGVGGPCPGQTTAGGQAAEPPGRRSYYRPSATCPNLNEHQIGVAIGLHRQGFPLPYIAKIIGRTPMAVSQVVRGKTKASVRILSRRKRLMANIVRMAGKRVARPPAPRPRITLGEIWGRIAA
jgi:hypothetical protein